MNTAEALEYLLGTTCSGCGGTLPGPGEPCGACGRIPDVTAPELAGDLDGPVALAAVEAAKLRAEAWQMHDLAVAKMAEADRAVFTARLQVRQAGAQRALDEHTRRYKSLHGPRSAARKAEEKAAAELADATRQHADIAKAEETARRMRHGVTAETEAAIRLERATAVLRRYQDELAAATARRELAEAAVEQSAARAAVLERARDEAVAAVMDPGRIPMSGETVTLGGTRLILSGRLDEVEMLMAGQTARLVCAATGVTSEIEMDVRRKVSAEQEEAAKGRALHLRNIGDGVLATPNPHNPGAPQPYHPPQYPAHPVQPATTPGW
jgi:hypothetical protein